MSRIGLLGGSFSPPTNAHLSIACFAKSQFQLDFVLLVPCSVPTIGKLEAPVAAHHRFNMCMMASSGIDWLKVADIELKPEPVYSYQTLEQLTQIHHGSNFFFIGGSDTLSKIDQWREPKKLASLTDFVIVPRNGDVQSTIDVLKSTGKSESGINILDFPRNDISSTIIRKRIRAGQPCDFMLAKSVIDYIRNNDLFKEAETGTD
ncbi:MAG: nicotinate (nicotinamide) nucleotide adenylyltransferase [Caldisericia bacterium]|nr:nicotinate (nicotinamide) nucleotide adenylyltransferase [Caldisericia bacterium]